MDCLVVADDLTGASDTGSAFAARGYRTAVVPSTQTGRAERPADVTVVNTDSRYVDEAIARDRLEQALGGNSPAVVYKKVDSTLRGNLVAEIETALEATGADVAVIAPAFPSTGRITVGGYHLVDGMPVSDTAAGEDRNGPATSHLPSLLDSASSSVAHYSLDAVSDADRLRECFDGFAESGERTLVVCDATTEAHLSAIARAADESSATPLYVGSAGLAEHVRIESPATVLGVVGSVATETFEQLEALSSEHVVELDPKAVIRDPDTATDSAVDAACDRCLDGGWVVVTAATEAADVTAARDAGREHSLGEGAVAERVADALGAVARGVHERMGLGGLFVTGGAVATATFEAVGVGSLHQTGNQVTDGVPIAVAEGGAADGLACVTKAGAFGGDMTILNALHALTGYHVPDSRDRRHDG